MRRILNYKDDDGFTEDSDADFYQDESDGGEVIVRDLSEDESFYDMFSDFKETVSQLWESMYEDPWGFIEEFWNMLMEYKKATVWVTVFVVLALLIGFPPIFSSNKSESVQLHYIKLSREAGSIVKNMKNIQPGSSLTLMRSLNHSARRLSGLDDSLSIKQPIIILVAVTDQKQIEQLTSEFEHAVEKYTDSFLVDFDCASPLSRMEFEKRIFSQLHQAQKRHKFLTLRNIDHLSNMSPLVLHSLADNESSPFKDLVIFATVTLDKMPEHLLTSNECTRLISNRLLDSWTSEELQPDQILPIISRLTATPTCVKLST
ncbi:hypothetical protein M3Y97_00231300 [Aphelenchoides bicaudatus]|nr:hypothetical protein M3Y97_00231300 [Aphelenchoides bicaudatus]